MKINDLKFQADILVIEYDTKRH